MIEFLESVGLWHWFIFGAVLIALEIFVAGAFLVWLGIAALMIGIMLVFIPMVWSLSVPLWAGLSLVLVLGYLLYRKRNPQAESPFRLNRRGEEFVGQTLTVTTPVVNGHGSARAGDTIWKIVSIQDLSAGAEVVVTAVEGTSLRVIAKTQENT